MSSLKEQIIAAKDVQIERVATPEWGIDVYVRAMSGASRDKFEQAVIASRDGDKYDNTGLRSMLIALTLCDADGNLVFELSDRKAIEGKNAAVLQRIFDASTKINGLASDAVEEAKSDFTQGRS